LSGSPHSIGIEPPTIQTPCRFAARERKSCAAPLPSRSRTDSLSRSPRPMKLQFSGNATRRAPALAASATSASAAAMFASTEAAETIWMAAARKGCISYTQDSPQKREGRRGPQKDCHPGDSDAEGARKARSRETRVGCRGPIHDPFAQHGVLGAFAVLRPP